MSGGVRCPSGGGAAVAILKRDGGLSVPDNGLQVDVPWTLFHTSDTSVFATGSAVAQKNASGDTYLWLLKPGVVIVSAQAIWNTTLTGATQASIRVGPSFYLDTLEWVTGDQDYFTNSESYASIVAQVTKLSAPVKLLTQVGQTNGAAATLSADFVRVWATYWPTSDPTAVY